MRGYWNLKIRFITINTNPLNEWVFYYKIDCIFLLAIKASITEKIWLRSSVSNLDTSKIRVLVFLSICTSSLTVRKSKDTSRISAILRAISIEGKTSFLSYLPNTFLWIHSWLAKSVWDIPFCFIGSETIFPKSIIRNFIGLKNLNTLEFKED